jgi:hypothetical protein
MSRMTNRPPWLCYLEPLEKVLGDAVGDGKRLCNSLLAPVRQRRHRGRRARDEARALDALHEALGQRRERPGELEVVAARLRVVDLDLAVVLLGEGGGGGVHLLHGLEVSLAGDVEHAVHPDGDGEALLVLRAQRRPRVRRPLGQDRGDLLEHGPRAGRQQRPLESLEQLCQRAALGAAHTAAAAIVVATQGRHEVDHHHHRVFDRNCARGMKRDE